MKAIFFDIDGVLNSNKFLCNSKGASINPQNVENLKVIVKATDAKLILTSDNRAAAVKEPVTDPEVKEMLDKFEAAGISLYGVIPADTDIAGKYEDYGKNYGIREYINIEGIDNFVILDDMDMGWDRIGLENYWINTENSVKGLSEDDVKRAIEILGR